MAGRRARGSELDNAERQALPRLALSVRQPAAWAIIYGGKDIENRTAGSVRAGRMEPGRICIHAATGMKREEYLWSVMKFRRAGARVPPPDRLVRGAIIGTVEVTDIVTESDSPWFGGPCGLVLRDPQPVDPPVPARGALGYFEWLADGEIAPVMPWMRRMGGDTDTLFPDLDVSLQTPPRRPCRKKE